MLRGRVDAATKQAGTKWGWQVRIATGEITVREARAIASFAHRPDVLAAVDADRSSNPDDWRTSADFERQLKFIAERFDGLTAAVAAGSGDPAGDDVGDDAEDPADGAGVQLLRRSLPVNHAPAVAGGKPGAAATALAVTPREALRMIGELVEIFTDPEDLARVQDLVDARGAMLRKMAKRKPSHRDN